MLGYADESGEPGVRKSKHDYFVFCIVLLKDKKQVSMIEKQIMDFRLKNGLLEDHEFHYAKDSKKLRLAFAKFLAELDFGFLIVSIKKDNTRTTASFARMASLVLSLFSKHGIDARVLMDINPKLFKELRCQKKKFTMDLHFAERKSQSSDLIQVADYVAAIYTRALKHPQDKSILQFYSLISKKQIDSIEE